MSYLDLLCCVSLIKQTNNWKISILKVHSVLLIWFQNASCIKKYSLIYLHLEPKLSGLTVMGTDQKRSDYCLAFLKFFRETTHITSQKLLGFDSSDVDSLQNPRLHIKYPKGNNKSQLNILILSRFPSASNPGPFLFSVTPILITVGKYFYIVFH